MAETHSSDGVANGGGDAPQWFVQPRDSIKDTIDSVIIAFILAFVFRAFVVEAFIIPTGSMAPTLYGTHGTIVCEDCGYEFAYNMMDTANRTRAMHEARDSRHSFGQSPQSAFLRYGGTIPQSKIICPNCEHPNGGLPSNDWDNTGDPGDRILVLKWPLDIGGERFKPHRWDVVVFKDPADGYTNFIKRLVGLPGEVLMLADGDVYTVPFEQLSQPSKDALETFVAEKHEFATRQRTGQLRALPEFVLDELREKLRIKRKSDVAQRALWRIVFDNDRPPINATDPVNNWSHVQPSWQAALRDMSGWKTDKRTLTFMDRQQPRDYIQLAGDPLDVMNGYNHAQQGFAAPPATDLRVSFVLQPGSSKGMVAVRLAKQKRAFWGCVYADGRVRIVESRTFPGANADLPALCSARIDPLSPDDWHEISFQHLDYQLSLHVDGKEVLVTSDEPGQPDYYAPDLFAITSEAYSFMSLMNEPGYSRGRHPWQAEAPRIYALSGDMTLKHLRVERDIYYMNAAFDSRVWVSQWCRYGWGTMNNPIYIRDGEYYFLGDNSAASKDSRLWDHIGPHLADRGMDFQLGTVPEDQLVGRAFFVYWPSGIRLPGIPLLDRVGVVPNVGRMRWIR